jgi:hypothetical protein
MTVIITCNYLIRNYIFNKIQNVALSTGWYPSFVLGKPLNPPQSIDVCPRFSMLCCPVYERSCEGLTKCARSVKDSLFQTSEAGQASDIIRGK